MGPTRCAPILVETAKVEFDRTLLNELASLRFIDPHHHVAIVGPVGVRPDSRWNLGLLLAVRRLLILVTARRWLGFVLGAAGRWSLAPIPDRWIR